MTASQFIAAIKEAAGPHGDPYVKVDGKNVCGVEADGNELRIKVDGPCAGQGNES